jgi:hypothetical protein
MTGDMNLLPEIIRCKEPDTNRPNCKPKLLIKFYVFTAVIMKNAVFWELTTCGYCKNRRFGGMHSLYLQGEQNQRARNNISSTYQLNLLVVPGPEIRTRFVAWTPLSRFLPEDGDTVQSPNRFKYTPWQLTMSKILINILTCYDNRTLDHILWNI